MWNVLSQWWINCTLTQIFILLTHRILGQDAKYKPLFHGNEHIAVEFGSGFVYSWCMNFYIKAKNIHGLEVIRFAPLVVSSYGLDMKVCRLTPFSCIEWGNFTRGTFQNIWYRGEVQFFAFLESLTFWIFCTLIPRSSGINFTNAFSHNCHISPLLLPQRSKKRNVFFFVSLSHTHSIKCKDQNHCPQ